MPPYKPVGDDYRIEPVPGRIAILASGGLDSSVMLAVLARNGRRVYPVYVRAGLSWEAGELATLKRFIRALRIKNIEPLTILKLPMGDISADHWSITGRNVPGYNAALTSNYIPGRNLSLLAKTVIFCAHARIGEIATQNKHAIRGDDQGRSSEARRCSATRTDRLMRAAQGQHPLRRMHQMRRTGRRICCGGSRRSDGLRPPTPPKTPVGASLAGCGKTFFS